MSDINDVRVEVFRFRSLIEGCDKENIELVLECFPIMSCKLSSMLLAYHLLQVWPKIEIRGVGAAAGRNGQITHYWLEVDGLAVDITGDQYNLIDDGLLNHNIIANRPFSDVHVCPKGDSYLYRIFTVKNYEPFTFGFPTIADDFIFDMESSYEKIMS